MTNAPDASPLPPSLPAPGDVLSDAGPPDGSSPAADFDFWRDVIGDDIVSGGVVYSSDEWTHDPEDGVRLLTSAEIAVREATRLHPEDPEHPDIVAAHTALDHERDTAMHIEQTMEEAIDQWRREELEEQSARDGEPAPTSEQLQEAHPAPPASTADPNATRLLRRRFRGARRLRRFIRR